MMDQQEMMLDYLIEMGALKPEQEAIARQRAQVQMMRDAGAMPGMRGMGGRVQTAANPLEFIAPVLNQYGAMQREKKADEREDAYGMSRRKGLTDLRGRMGAARRPTGAVPVPMMPGDAPTIPDGYGSPF